MTEHLINQNNMPRTKEQFEEIRNKTKRNIIDAALKLFAHRGYHGTSIAEIAKEAGVSKGLAYNYFSSKSELADAIFAQIYSLFDEFDQLFEQIDDPYKALELLIKNTFKTLRDDREFWKLYTSFGLQQELSDNMSNMFKVIESKYISKLIKLFRKIGVKNPKAEAYLLGAILDGVPVDYLIADENYPLKSVENLLLKKYSKENLLSQI